MNHIFRLFLFRSVCVAICSSAENKYPETSRVALGGAAQVFEIIRGEVLLDLPVLKRIEVGKESVVFMVRNESQESVAPEITAEFFNQYGMRICTFEGSFEPLYVQPGEVAVRQFRIVYPELESIFKNSTIQLPVNWRELRFVRLNVTSRESLTAIQPAIEPRKPRPRPQVVQIQQVRPSILTEQRIGTTNVGLTAIDAKFSQYGAYLQRMIDSVQIQWERIILQMTAMPAGGSTVSVKFIMSGEGKITSIKTVESNASETASRACMNAISDRSPYGPWTDDMKAVLGTQQEMTFTFFYQ